MKMTSLTPAIKTHLLRVFAQFQEGRLTQGEEIQLMQDLYDSGLYIQMTPDVKVLIRNLLAKGKIQRKPGDLN